MILRRARGTSSSRNDAEDPAGLPNVFRYSCTRDGGVRTDGDEPVAHWRPASRRVPTAKVKLDCVELGISVIDFVAVSAAMGSSPRKKRGALNERNSSVVDAESVPVRCRQIADDG